MTSGFQKSELIIIGARPLSERRARADDGGAHGDQEKIPTAFFSLEMSDMQLMMRLLSSEAHIRRRTSARASSG
jgi:replicative DNA helicase